MTNRPQRPVGEAAIIFFDMTHADLIGVVRDLIGEVTRMRAKTEKLGGALAKLRVEHQAVKDELARLKHLDNVNLAKSLLRSPELAVA